MDLTTTILTSFATSVATNGAKAPLQSLDNLWYMTFGHKVEYLAEIKRAKNEVNVSQYKESISKKIDAIPEENLQEPPMSIVGPALEASKYYIEEEELREMFANVIASSMDNRKSDNVHHSFVEIIKQLSPRDARNIEFLKDIRYFPIVNYTLNEKDSSGVRMIKELVFTTDLEKGNIEEADSASISNLARLGLISISFIQTIAKEEAYTIFELNTYANNLRRDFEIQNKSVDIERGSLAKTPLGSLFVNTCL
ncbi:DUF4393 domain-containing protein [Planococcus sp. SIMBA_143]